MIESRFFDPSASFRAQANHALGWLHSFGLAFLSGVVATANIVVESFNALRLSAVLGLLVGLHLLRHPRFLFNREAAIYVLFVGYMITAVLWTDDVRLALNTLLPAFAFVIILVLFGSLASYHDLKPILAGALLGVSTGAGAYTLLSGFPFVYPANFSYNAVAGMYLCGLFVTLLLSLYTRSKGALLFVALVFFAHIVATTSIKFNLGVLLGVLTAGLAYFGFFMRTLRRNLLAVVVFLGVVAYVVVSQEGLREVLERGTDRVMLGLEVLQARDNVPGYGAFESRARWQSDGITGWLRNPLFGYGVEAFRDRYGVTSHSTPVDLLYNFGLIGFLLFYAVPASVFWRVCRRSHPHHDGLRALILGTLVCYAFISLSAPIHYNAFFGLVTALSITALHRAGIEEAER